MKLVFRTCKFEAKNPQDIRSEHLTMIGEPRLYDGSL